MSCGMSCGINANNHLYMNESDDRMFHHWFSKAWTLKYPDRPLLDKKIKTITLVVTQNCNFLCTYCYEHSKNGLRMSKDMIKPIVDFILDDSKYHGYVDSYDSPCVILDFIGGEPLLEVDLIDEFMEYFKFRTFELGHPWGTNYMISMSSNGSLYKTKKVQDFIAKNLGRVSIGITLDGNKELHDKCRVYTDGSGTYDDVLENVKIWVEQYDRKTSTKVTLSPDNLDYLVEAIEHIWSLDISIINANVVFEDVWNTELATKYYNILIQLANTILDKDLYRNKYTTLFTEAIGKPMVEQENGNWCGGDGSMLAIGTDGVVYPCMRYMNFCLGNKERKPLIIGNIYEGVGVTEEQRNEIKELTNITRRSQSDDKCFNCPVGKGCAWCSAFNYDTFGTANKRTTFICEMHQARVLANVYFWNSLYRKLNLHQRFELHLPEDWATKIITIEEYNKLNELSREDY